MRLHIPLRNWLDEQVLVEPGLERLALSNMDWKKLKYLITSAIRETRQFAGFVSQASEYLSFAASTMSN